MEYKISDLSQIHHGVAPVNHGLYLFSTFDHGWLQDFVETGKFDVGYSFSGGLSKFDGSGKLDWANGYWVGLRAKQK